MQDRYGLRRQVGLKHRGDAGEFEQVGGTKTFHVDSRVVLATNEDLSKAVADGRFNVYPIERIDQGIELLTGMPAGTRGPDGEFPEGTIFRKVADRLREMAEARQKFGQQRNAGNTSNGQTS